MHILGDRGGRGRGEEWARREIGEMEERGERARGVKRGGKGEGGGERESEGWTRVSEVRREGEGEGATEGEGVA